MSLLICFWFGAGGTLTDPGANPGEHPAPQGNRRQPWRSSQNQRSKRTPGASPKERGVFLSLHSRADRTCPLNHSPNNRRSRSSSSIGPRPVAPREMTLHSLRRGGLQMRKTALLLATGLVLGPAPAFAHHKHHLVSVAHHPHHLVTSCNSYKVVKKFVPARFNRYGQLVGGHWKTKRKCAHPTRTLLVSSPYHRHIHSTHIHHHTSVPVVAKEPKVVHQQVATAPVNRCEDKLARMGVGGVLGGVVGRFAVGGSKSSNTVLGTTVGAVAGSLVGAATC